MNRGLAKKRAVLKAVEENPGAGFIDLMKLTGFANGVLSHHLGVLEKEGVVRINHWKRKIWVFKSELDPNEDNIRISFRKETCKQILLHLLNENSANLQQIQEAIKKSPATTSGTLKKLVYLQVIQIIPGFPKKYTLVDFEKTTKILNSITVTQTDELKDRFADTFSYL